MRTVTWIKRAAVLAVTVAVITSLGAPTVRGAGEAVKNPDTFVELQFGDALPHLLHAPHVRRWRTTSTPPSRSGPTSMRR